MKATQELCDILDGFGLPYYRQGSAPQDGTLPQTFLTYWKISAKPLMDYDNDHHQETGMFSVILYSKDMNSMAEIDRLAGVLKANGWGIPSLPSDYPAWNEYYSRGINALVLIAKQNTEEH